MQSFLSISFRFFLGDLPVHSAKRAISLVTEFVVIILESE